MTDWDDIVFRFRNQTLAKEEWTHVAHLVAALWFLLEYKDVDGALPNLRLSLVLFNRSVGKTNVNPHETITGFWLREIAAFIQWNTSRDFTVLAEALLQESAFFDPAYIHRFYAKEILSNSAAKTTYIAP